MSDKNHPVKSASGTAGLVAGIVSLTPEHLREHEAFLYILSTIPPFIVWAQNWFWKNGATVAANIGGKARSWKMERDIKKVMKDPLVNSGHKAKLKKAYSESKTDGLLSKIEDIKESLQ